MKTVPLPKQQQYTLNIPPPHAQTTTTQKAQLFIAHITTAAPFDRFDFLYKNKNNQYVVDYYNSFLIPPSQQIYPSLVSYINNLSKFQAITNFDNIGPEDKPNELHTKITALFADYSNDKSPKAVITLHLTVAQRMDGKAVTVLDKTISATEPLTTKDSNGLIAAWNKAMQKILLGVVGALK